MVENTEEIRKWRALSQSEMDLCWKNLPGRMEGEVLENTRSKKAKEAFRGRGTSWNGGGHAKKEVERRLLGDNFLFV